MNTDSFFTIGKTHNVCQDYASHGLDHIIVSDGCSSSPDTDFGSRFLTKACEQALYKSDLQDKRIIYSAAGMVRNVGLYEECLDATLLYARIQDNLIKVRVYGDGNIIVVFKDGSVGNIKIEFESGAPLYLSYLLDDIRYSRYKDFFGTKRNISYFNIPKIGIEYEFSFFCAFDINKIDKLFLTSDGLQTFNCFRSDATVKCPEHIDEGEIISQLTNIKTINGEFIKRRCKKFFNKFCLENGWFHNDDFSIAALVI